MSGKLAGWLAFVAIFAGLNYAARFADGGETDNDVLYTWEAAILGVAQYAIILGIMLLIARGLPKREAFALRRPTSWPRAVGLAVIVFVGVFVLAGILQPFLEPGEEQGLVPDEWDAERAAPFAANYALVSLVGPTVEELSFRGLGYTLLERYGRPTAVVAVGVAFGLVHGLVEALPLLAAFGIGLAYLRARTTSVYPSIALHGVFNAAVLAFAVLA